MVRNRFVIEIVKETVNATDTAAAAAAAPAAAADEMRTTAPEKDTTKATDMTILEASEDTDTNHLLRLTEAHWFVGGYRILKFLATLSSPFHAEGKKGIAACCRSSNSNEPSPMTAFATTSTTSSPFEIPYSIQPVLKIRRHIQALSPNPLEPQLPMDSPGSVTDTTMGHSAWHLRRRFASRLSNIEHFLLSRQPAASGKYVF